MRIVPKDRFQLEDRGRWQELSRTPEVKNYSAAVRRLLRRSVILRLISLVGAGYIAYLIIYFIGIGHLGPQASASERHASLMTAIGCIIAFGFFLMPLVIAIYRGRWNRVSVRQESDSRAQAA